MRSNPFYDAWLFLTGAADYPAEIGALKYVLVALYWMLVLESCFIALVNWRDDPAQRDKAHVAIQWFLWKSFPLTSA
jgi:hypothetical protein